MIQLLHFLGFQSNLLSRCLRFLLFIYFLFKPVNICDQSNWFYLEITLSFIREVLGNCGMWYFKSK